jgi:hypothetical protein
VCFNAAPFPLYLPPTACRPFVVAMSDSLLDLFNSPPAPPPRLPSRSRSHSRSASPGPSRLPTLDSAPLFFSPGSVSSTPARPKRARDVPSPPRQPLFSTNHADRAGRDDPVVDSLDLDGEWDINAPLPDLPLPLRDPRWDSPSDLPLGQDVSGGLGDLDPFKDLHRDEEEQAGKKKRVVPKIDADRWVEKRRKLVGVSAPVLTLQAHVGSRLPGADKIGDEVQAARQGSRGGSTWIQHCVATTPRQDLIIRPSRDCICTIPQLQLGSSYPSYDPTLHRLTAPHCAPSRELRPRPR